MGYTTEFTGRFDVYRPEGPMMAEFLRAIAAGDAAARSAFVDWLIEHSDPRGERAARLPADDRERFWQLFGLRAEHADYLRLFSRTRRMKRDPARAALLPDPVREAAGLPLGQDAGYFVGGVGHYGQDSDPSVLDLNRPPDGQPGLWCQWVPNDANTALEWNGAEKFYDYVKWLRYLLDHFLTPWGYVVNGRVEWQGEDDEDQGTITVQSNQVKATATRRG